MINKENVFLAALAGLASRKDLSAKKMVSFAMNVAKEWEEVSAVDLEDELEVKLERFNYETAQAFQEEGEDDLKYLCKTRCIKTSWQGK
jgi:hypothetical protein